MSPEQISGQDLDGRTDIFAVGCALYEMLTGQRPFPGDSIGTVLYRIMNEDPEPSPKLDAVAPQLLKSIILRALAKKPNDRYQTCADIINDLKQCKQIGEAAGMISPLPAPETVQTATITAPGTLPAVSPFTYGNPITDPERFYGRRREIEQIFDQGHRWSYAHLLARGRVILPVLFLILIGLTMNQGRQDEPIRQVFVGSFRTACREIKMAGEIRRVSTEKSIAAKKYILIS